MRKADVLYSQGEIASAVAAYRSVLALDPKQLDAWTSLGFALMKDGQPPFDEAREAFEKAIGIDPLFADPHQGLGLLYTELGDLKEAETWFSAANRLSPGRTYVPGEILRRAALLSKGLTLFDRNIRHDEALAAYDQAIARSPRNIKAWRGRADLLFLRDELRSAAAIYRELISWGVEDRELIDTAAGLFYELGGMEQELVIWNLWLENHPSDTEAHLEHAELLFIMDRLGDAVVAYERAIESDPGNTEAHYLRAESLNFLDRKKEALEAYGRLAELDPENFDAHFEMGLLLETLGKPLAALESHARASSIDPTAAEPIYTRGVLFGELGRFEKARKAFVTATKLDSEHQRAWANLGWILLELGDEAASLEATERSLELDPDDAVALTNQGVALLNLGRYEEALVIFDRVLESEKTAGAHENRGLALTALERNEEARDSFSTATKLDPTHQRAWANLGRTLLLLDERPASLVALERALLLDPEDTGVLGNRGVALMRLGRHEEALVVLDRVLETVDAPNEHFNRSLVLRGLGRKEESMQALERSVALKHDKLDAWMVLAETAIELGLDARASEAIERLASLQATQAGSYLNRQAWNLVDPDRQDRTTDVALGLRLARACILLDPRSVALRDTLAWALFGNGHFEEALLQSKQAIELAPGEQVAEFQGYRERMAEMIQTAEGTSPPNADDHE